MTDAVVKPVPTPDDRTISQQLAQFVCGFSLDQAPEEVVTRARLLCLDTLVVALAGSFATSTAIVSKLVQDAGARPECTLIGQSARTTALLAGLANGTAAHAVELDDDHRTSVLHPGTVVVPAALAMAETAGASGKSLLEGIIVGYEAMTRIGDAFLGRQYYSGFHATGTCGVFGAAGACARILNLSAKQTTTALGIAGTQAAGLGEWANDGSWIKRLHPGKSAEAGIMAALLARDGFTAPSTILEGKLGFLRAFSDQGVWDADVILSGLGTEYRGHGTSFKPYAGCRFSHQVVDAALDIAREHRIAPDDVGSVHVRLHTTSYKKLFVPTDARYTPSTPVDAQFSIPYIVATALLYGRPMPVHFTEEAIRDPKVLAMAAQVSGEPDDDYERLYPQRYPAQVSISVRDGATHSAYCDLPSGDPEHDRYKADAGRFESEILDKIRALFASLPDFADRCDDLIAEVTMLDRRSDLSRLSQLLSR